MKISNAYLTFRNQIGEEIQVSISDILYSGIPIDEDDGRDLELVSDEIEEKKEIIIEDKREIKMTMGELQSRCWMKACDVLGLNEWYFAEGGSKESMNYISFEEAKKLGICKEEFDSRAV
jgi:hypothetical protein